MKDPQGVIQMLIGSDGRVVAHVADFNLDGYGGFTIEEAQRVRCRRALAFAVIEAFASPVLTRAISGYHADHIVDSLVKKQGYRKHEIVIGHAHD